MTAHISDRNDVRSPTVPVYILAGGRSRRYGSDKARLVIEGQPLLVRVARELADLASSMTVVARSAGDYDDLGLRTIRDSIPDKGPMGGLLAAFEDAGPAEWLFLTACDWVGIRVGWARKLVDARREDVRAVVYRSDRYHPLFGLYHTAAQDDVLRHIHDDDLKMQHLLDRLPTRSMPVPDDWDELINLNRPAEKNGHGEA